jgi:hypothetical protein
MRRPVKGQYRLPVPVYLYRRRDNDGNPNNSPEEEIETESSGLFFVLESSTPSQINYIITE